MRIAVFSDIHGNMEALEAFLADVAGRHVDRYVCLGDLVGYGASPNECIERLDSLASVRFVKGNHDAAALWQSSPYEMSSGAKTAILWTMDRLTPENLERLKALDDRFQDDRIQFCHANPLRSMNWRYVNTWFSAFRSFLSSRSRWIFVGHTHRPLVISRQTQFKLDFVTPKSESPFELDPDRRYIINCGSIGQPRDGNPDACYAILDTRNQWLEFRRVSYDIQSTAEKIRSAGLPEYLATRLFKGR